jgi:hypothetical protein
VKGHRQILVIQAPTNLSGPEIASKVSVSVNTVNTDVRNINAKLQAPRSGEGHALICKLGAWKGSAPVHRVGASAKHNRDDGDGRRERHASSGHTPVCRSG